MVSAVKSFGNGPRMRHWLVLAGIGLTVPLGVSQALGADPGTEAEPGGPPACSVVAGRLPLGGIGIDLWVQCNYHVIEMTVKSGNRKLTSFPRTPEIVGAEPGDSMACGLGRHRQVACKGRLSAFGRIHAQVGVDEDICETPRLRLSVATFGGPECTGNCSGIGFATMAPSPTNRRSMGCNGG